MAEPDSKTITSEELATRVRRVVGRRFRRDSASECVPAAPKARRNAKHWTAQGYDFLIISLALFVVTVLLLNLTIAGSWRERNTPWDDRANWQRELRAWEQQLTKQEQRLEAECQELAAILIARRNPEAAQQMLDQVSELRQQLREASQSLALIPHDDIPIAAAPAENNRDSDPLSVAVLKSKREQLIESQYAARTQFNSGHPKLDELEQQLDELEKQLAMAEAASLAGDADSRVQVIENQYLRNASVSPTPRPAPKQSEHSPEFRRVEFAFAQLRQTTERLLRELDTQDSALQQSDNQRAIAWEQVATALRSMARDCAIPAALQQKLEQQPQLRSEPTLSPLGLLAGIACSLACSGFVLWYSRWNAGQSMARVNSSEEQLSINLVTKHLGCAPGVIVPWETQSLEADAASSPVPAVLPDQTLQHKLRLASEWLLAVSIAATVLLTLTHGQFGDWLQANPLTAWGRWWGS